jgi:hypothetical protein
LTKQFETCVLTDCKSDPIDLNKSCFCKTLNSQLLHKILKDDDVSGDTFEQFPQLFSNTSVFISRDHFQQMQESILSIVRVTKLPSFRAHVLNRSPAIAAYSPGNEGVFMGYDFHIGAKGPQLIEINTNAGGAFLNAALVKAQTKCCPITDSEPSIKNLNQTFVDMFLQEWQLQRKTAVLKSIAIVDENPETQFLYPEFLLAKRLFEQGGLNAFIIDPSEMTYNNNQLLYGNQVIDIVYNRLTDFYLSDARHDALRQAYEENAVVVTPNPHQYALFADKRNLTDLTDLQLLESYGATPEDIAILQKSIPATTTVTADNAEQLWQTRKQYFFKPVTGFGSRATYRGDKLTKRVWSEILSGAYVAQELVAPSERSILLDDQESSLKMDIRAYVYAGKIQLLAARLYQGQTTNFRTPGGGFAPVFIATQNH